MRTRLPMTVALTTAGMLTLGGIAYAAVQSVSNSPAPQVVVPSSASVERASHGDDGTHDRHGADDPAGHDATDDNTSTSGGHGADDNGGSPSGGGHGSDG